MAEPLHSLRRTNIPTDHSITL